MDEGVNLMWCGVASLYVSSPDYVWASDGLIALAERLEIRDLERLV